MGKERTPLRVIFVRGVEEGAAEADAHYAKIWDVSEEGILTAPVFVDPMDGI